MNITGLKENYLQDLNYFLEYAESKRGEENDVKYPLESMHLNFYLNHSKKELEEFINEYLSSNKVESNYDFYYMLNCIIKYMSGVSDSHTRIYFLENTFFPIRFKIIDNCVYIDRCFAPKYIKKKITKINGVDINKIINEIEKCTSYGTTGWLYTNIEKMLKNKNDLLSLPSIKDNIKEIVFETEDEEAISFDTEKNYDKYVVYPQPDDNQYIVKDDTLIFKYPSCKDKYAPDVEKIDNLINQNNISKFILDLRGNAGGNSSIIIDLLYYLSESELELFTLVDKEVFSSGRFAAVSMKKIGSKIIGEEIGTPINCFGYVCGNGITPNSKINFNFAKVYWYEKDNKMEGIYTKEDLNKKKKEFFEPKYLSIDIPIKVSSEEYINAVDDICLQKCIEEVSSSKINLINNI